ncbi:MAG: hypothetical protein NZL83_04050 [Candidatus Absconditabacterales bacterium]|nr:hypothetical protein [Candidatus Absconditabacterales bacterium]
MINIEYSLRMGDRMDGHLVTGHIDCRGEILTIQDAVDGSRQRRSGYPSSFSHLIIPKGSIALNGVSLTVADDDRMTRQSSFSVWLIPLTLKLTNLSLLQPGDYVNLEFNLFAKYAHKRPS